MSWKKREREKQPLVNWQIRYPQVRVVSEDGKNLGVVPTKKAIFMAKDEGKDLITAEILFHLEEYLTFYPSTFFGNPQLRS